MHHFEYRTFVTLSDTDAAQVMYFARFYDLAHKALENYMIDKDLSLGSIIGDKDYLTPLTASSAEYKRPLRLSDQVLIRGAFEIDTESSFHTLLHIFLPNDQLAATVRFTHACIDKVTWKRRALPAEMKKLLSDTA